MISKNKIKFVTSLHRKKDRDESQCYIAEGDKLVGELLGSNKKVLSIFALPEWFDAHVALVKPGVEWLEVSRDEMSRISSLVTPQDVMCIVEQEHHSVHVDQLAREISLALDTIQDPGNMGTILRLADWFGIRHVLCSPGCVDIYNPKVVQATMGAMCRVEVCAVDLPCLLGELRGMDGFDIYGTFLAGENIYTATLAPRGVIVLGNEGNGISPAVECFVSKRVHIPSFNPRGAVESLNVSAAAAVVCSEFMRRM